MKPYIPSTARLPFPLAIALAALISAQSGQAADFFWDPASSGTNTGSGSGTWNAANTNWFNGTTNVFWATGNRPVFGGADGPFTVGVENDFSTTGLFFNTTGYTLSAASAQTITSTTGTVSLASSSVTATIGSNVTFTRGSNDTITTTPGTGGTLNIGSADQLSTSARYINTQSGSTGTRTLSITNGTLVNVNSGGYFGQSPDTVYDTAVNPNGTSIVIGSATGGSLVVKTGGTVTNGNNQAFILGGASASGTLTIDGGQVNAGTVTVGTTGVLPAASVYAGLRFGAGSANASGTRIANLNGGTLTVGQVYAGAGTGMTNTFNFNGGTLQASIANTTFMTGLTTANVLAGGAKIDTNSFDITIGQALIHDAALGATLDGGLTKSSAGTLTLTSSATYTGNTTISGGTLKLSGASGKLGGGSYAGAMSIAPGATFENASTGTQTLSGAITGGGTLKNSGGGGLVLSNGNNSYGALSISNANSRVFINTNTAALPSAATVEITSGALVFSTPATRDNAITVSSGGVLSARAATTLCNVTLPISGSIILNNDDANTSLLTISNGQTLTGNLTVQVGGSRMGMATTTLGAVTLSGNLTGGGGLVVASSGNFANNPTLFGTGVVTLSGNNTYTGDTTVNSGVLAVTGTSIADTGKLVINDSGKVNLTNTESVSKLFFGLIEQPLGSYSASSVPDGATITTASFTGSGTLTVGTPTGGFSSWIIQAFVNGNVPALQQGPNDDPDNDGISNLVEYAIAGEDPTVSKSSIGSFNGNLLSFSKRLDASGLTYAIQDSTDLGIADTWAEVGSYTENTASTISYTLTPGTPVRNFLRLQVLSN